MGNSLGRSDPVDFNGEVELRHFNLLRCVGKGAFGKVRIVEKRDTQKLYALKYINKLQCIRMRAIQNIFRERAILEEINHPLIVNLRFAFQDDENMFMVIDLMMGGDLRFHLDRLGGFQEEAVRIIAAEMVCSIVYLHSKGIVHRDLKPDNVLLDGDGHAHLTDFNIAVKYEDRKYLKSHSGTLAYMAPEIFGNSGYLWQIDFWSLGVVIYELLWGKRPFRSNSNEGLTVAITQADVVFYPNNLLNKNPVNVSNECLSFIRGLLERDIGKRLGCGGRGSADVFEHPWFAGLDWRMVENKQVKPGFVPEADKPNFDATYDLEELLLDENPLSYRPRKRKPTKKETNKNDKTPGTSKDQLQFQYQDNAPNYKNERATSQIGNTSTSAAAAAAAAADPLAAMQQMHRNKSFGGGLANPTAGGITPGTSKSMGGDRTAAELQFIEDNFKSFDSTMYERYPGIVDNTTLRVADPPRWVKEAGTTAMSFGLGGAGSSQSLAGASVSRRERERERGDRGEREERDRRMNNNNGGGGVPIDRLNNTSMAPPGARKPTGGNGYNNDYYGGNGGAMTAAAAAAAAGQYGPPLSQTSSGNGNSHAALVAAPSITGIPPMPLQAGTPRVPPVTQPQPAAVFANNMNMNSGSVGMMGGSGSTGDFSGSLSSSPKTGGFMMNNAARQPGALSNSRSGSLGQMVQQLPSSQSQVLLQQQQQQQQQASYSPQQVYNGVVLQQMMGAAAAAASGTPRQASPQPTQQQYSLEVPIPPLQLQLQQAVANV
ncbi:hypothetical protein HDU76_013102 [Blyttiomyces sp. JEL0837]|nr:hypothetical protein HDU76_013102 [Blyttiomyces sp. JEL0837]